MAINSVWVFAQVTNGAATTGTLELLTKARSLSSNVTAVLGGDASGVAAQLGEYGATKVYATGDLAGKLPGVAVSGAMKAIIDGGDKPDLILFPQNYEGRDVLSRLSVKLNKSVLTNSIDVAVDGDAVNATTPIFGGNTLVTTTSQVKAHTSLRSVQRVLLLKHRAALLLLLPLQVFPTSVQQVAQK